MPSCEECYSCAELHKAELKRLRGCIEVLEAKVREMAKIDEPGPGQPAELAPRKALPLAESQQQCSELPGPGSTHERKCANCGTTENVSTCPHGEILCGECRSEAMQCDECWKILTDDMGPGAADTDQQRPTDESVANSTDNRAGGLATPEANPTATGDKPDQAPPQHCHEVHGAPLATDGKLHLCGKCNNWHTESYCRALPCSGGDPAPVYCSKCVDTALRQARKELEREQLRLAACSVAARANTPDSAAGRINRDHPYWSASYADVCLAVDREMDLRAKLAAAERERDEWQGISSRHSDEIADLNLVIDHHECVEGQLRTDNERLTRERDTYLKALHDLDPRVIQLEANATEIKADRDALRERCGRYKKALEQLSEIRHCIITKGVTDWSRDIYPMVAILNAALAEPDAGRGESK